MISKYGLTMPRIDHTAGDLLMTGTQYALQHTDFPVTHSWETPLELHTALQAGYSHQLFTPERRKLSTDYITTVEANTVQICIRRLPGPSVRTRSHRKQALRRCSA